jgi:hypothetical protein
MIIGICGLIGSGKDTIADYLQNIHQFRRESFAHTLKDAVSAVFGWNRELLEGRTRESREWREQRDEWWSERLGKEITPRWVLQFWGTNLCRQNFHDNIWIASLENKLRTTNDDIVISDCRFPNEIASIRNAGGIVIRVIRGPEPAWYQDAVDTNAGISESMNFRSDVHPSEWGWIGTNFDAIVDNNSDGLDNLYSQVKHLIQDLQVSKVSQP